METGKQTMPVSERAMVQRINRKLRPYEWLRAARGEQQRASLGFYYVLDVRHNLPTDTNVNLEELGRELGVLADYEHVLYAE